MKNVARIIKDLIDFIFFFTIGILAFFIMILFFIIGLVENAMSRK